MRKFLINSVHDCHLENYEHGELQYVNGYNQEAVINAENPREAISKYFENELYYNFSFENAVVLHEQEEEDDNNKNKLFYDVLVDVENSEASKKDIELWKEGKIQLYSNSIHLTICEVLPITI